MSAGARGCSGAWPQVSHHLLPESGWSRATAMRQGGQRVLGTLSRAQFSSGEEAAERLCCLQEQAELKLRASELRAKEDQLAAEREALEQERRELRLEKERVSAAAQRIRLRAEEVESMSQVPSGSAPGHGQCTHPASPADPGGLPAGGLAEVYIMSLYHC